MSTDGAIFPWTLRLLIILYGSGIVALGLHPIQEKHGSIFNFIAKDSFVDAAERTKASILNSATAVHSESAPKEAEDHPAVAPRGEKRVDALSNDDRKQLNNLIEGLK